MIPQPTLETDRLFLRPFEASDAQDVFEYASDNEVTRYLNWDAHKTLQDSKSFLDWVRHSSSYDPGKLSLVFAIQLKFSGKVIGSIDFKRINKFCGQTDYALKKEFWGQGLMSEAARGIRDWAFKEFPEIVRFQAYCQPENIGSKRVMEKIGMEYEGLRRKSFVIRDKPVDLVHYALVR